MTLRRAIIVSMVDSLFGLLIVDVVMALEFSLTFQ